MNFLAHAYLSFDDPDITVGNLIADTVRGKQIYDLPARVREGILIHRAIDEFTDNHVVNKEAKLLFRDVAGRYDSSFLDVSYDHFLAIDPLNEPAGGWAAFAQRCYKAVEQHGDVLPQVFCNIYMYMRGEDWLSTYHLRESIDQSFMRLKRRASFLGDDTPVFAEFEKHYDAIQESYTAFFPDLKRFAEGLVNEKPIPSDLPALGIL